MSTSPIYVKLHLWRKRTDGRTDRQMLGIEFGTFLPLNVTFGGNNFNDFDNDLLNKFRVFYWLIPDFAPPPKIYTKHSDSFPQ